MHAYTRGWRCSREETQTEQATLSGRASKLDRWGYGHALLFVFTSN